MMVGVEDLKVKVFLPPEGYVWNHHKEELELCEVISRSSIKEEQYWEAPLPPDNYSKKLSKEKAMQKMDPDYIDPDLEKYRKREWHRRLYGVWVMINGKMIFFTGLYYFYLTHWRIDIGRPKFRYWDLMKAYFTDFCVEDPDSFGFTEVTKRRNGKTYWGGCFITEHATRTKNAWSGIQSKVEADAKSVFGKAVVQPFRKLPEFFKPQYDRTGGDVPKSELRFYETSKKGFIDDFEYDSNELETKINYRNSKPEAYDGEKLTRYLCDEVFKTKDVNVLERHDAVKPCFLAEDSETIIGKAIYTSTVEDIEGQIDQYIELWDDSNQSKKLSDNRTKSGLYRWFTPAQHTMYLDKYGYPDSEKGLARILAKRLDLADDPRALASYIRKNPTNWKEAFRTSGDDCLYNAIKIDERLDILNWKEDATERYDLVWETEEKKAVKLVKNPNGRFRFSWTFEKAGHPELANNVKIRGENVLPQNILKFVIGIDPYDHNKTKNGRFSKGAAAVFMKFDPLDQDNSDNFVATYLGRPQTARLFYEDMIKLCHYFSCQMLFEDQKQGILTHFKDRGYGAFVMRDEKGHEGISAHTKVHQAIVEATELFIEENCHRVNHSELLTDWKSFDMNDTERFDMGMASGYALIAANRMQRRQDVIIKRKKINVSKFQRTYKIRKHEKRFSKSLVTA